MGSQRLSGAFTAIVTPFKQNGSIDEKALRVLVDRQVEAGISGIVPCGTTGEASALTIEEHQKVVSIVVKQSDGKATIIAGAGANNTNKAIELSKACEDAGADNLLHIAPGYIKPTQNGIIRHVEAILHATDLPIVLYNVPSRTSITIEPSTVLHLAQNPQVIAIKQAVADFDQLWKIIDGRPASFAVLSGEDSLTLPMIAMGADGLVSVVGNERPMATVNLIRAALSGSRDEAIDLHRQLAPLMSANFVESNPIPVKFALSEMGLIENILRIPMTPLAKEFQSIVIDAVRQSESAPIPANTQTAVIH